ncbi:MAG: hypothetical protein NO516_05200 [Candidatus Methanomethylicia archaeon]|nr:hypothetical protein [Candidatus Methanomethylicia archaeon]
MEKKRRALGVAIGLSTPGVMAIAVLTCATVSPWFRWNSNALSDFGHVGRGGVAAIFNGGLAVSGLLMVVYALAFLRPHAKYTSYSLAAAGFGVQLAATFNESFGLLHIAAALFVFSMIFTTSVVYFFERGSRVSLLSVTALIPLALMVRPSIGYGIAILEVAAGLAFAPWFIASMVGAFRDL